jgi:transposase
LIDGLLGSAGKVARPRRRAGRRIADGGYDHDKHRRACARASSPSSPRRGTGHGSGLGRERWVVERTRGWLHNLRLRRSRYERPPELHGALLHLGSAVIAQRMLTCGEDRPHAYSSSSSSPSRRRRRC